MERFSPTLTDSERADLVALRRDFHRHPELGFQETRTMGVIAERLRALGLEPRTGVAGTGVVAVMDSGRPGPTLLLRSDMDALPVTEVADRAYRSETEGVMHACGHDGHMATLLTAAAVLRRLGEPKRGRLKLVFQPAEEGEGGAEHMIAEGVLADPPVDAALALHYWSQLPTGEAAVVAGPFMASVDDFTIRVIGQGGHAAMPHEVPDALVAGAAVVTALQTIVSRRTNPMLPVVVTVGAFHAGHAFNVIADKAVLRGTCRAFDEEVWLSLPGHVERVAKAAAEVHGCTVEVEFQRLHRAVVNDAEMTAHVRETVAGLLGEDSIAELRTMGGEDVSEYLSRVPGCFFFVGSGDAAKGTMAPHHSAAFDLDEDALPIGCELLVRLARDYLAGED
ncbi:MAG: amidohydrolase [Candidatus Krumholzibacteriota bacterium]|nr:amidohydrolase [Candidatus Krumholzibacteriota bacterium]